MHKIRDAKIVLDPSLEHGFSPLPEGWWVIEHPIPKLRRRQHKTQMRACLWGNGVTRWHPKSSSPRLTFCRGAVLWAATGLSVWFFIPECASKSFWIQNRHTHTQADGSLFEYQHQTEDALDTHTCEERGIHVLRTCRTPCLSFMTRGGLLSWQEMWLVL